MTTAMRSPPRPKKRMALLWQVLGLLIILFIWWLAADVFKIRPDYILARPEGVWTELKFGFNGSGPQDGKLLRAIANSLRRMLLAYSSGIVLGSLVGLLLSTWRPLRDVLGAYLQGLQSIPSIVFVPPAIMLFGLNERAVFAVVLLEAFIPIALAISGSLLNVPPIWRIAGRTLGAKRFHLITRVLFPAALPNIIVGLRTSWSFAWRALVGAELLVSTPGLGQSVEVGRNTSNMALVVATIFIIGLIGVFFDMLIRAWEGRIRRDYGLEVAA